MNTIKFRLKDLAAHYGLSIRTFEEKCGLNRGNISNMSDNGSIGSDKLSKILDTYAEINPIWLITGNGNMLRDAQVSDTNMTTGAIDTRPRIPMEAAAGSLSVALNSVTADECEQLPVISLFPKYDFTIIVRGESMEPEYKSGDELACLMISENSFIQWGRTYVLDTAQGIVVKRVFDDMSNLLCKSNNPDYPDFKIPKEEVYRMALVVGSIRIQ